MNSLQQLSFIGLAIALFLTSCTMEKRVYMSGYHIEWLNNKHNPSKNELASMDNLKKSEKKIPLTVELSETSTNMANNYFAPTATEYNITASVNNLPELTPTIHLPNKNVQILKKSEMKNITLSEDCDVIILKNGQEIKAKVLEVGSNEIKYKECSNLNGPTFSKNNSEVFMIKYPNGTNTVISSVETKNKSSQNSTGTTNNKSQTVALILCIFLGVIGVHRFYLGHIGIGILYLLTGGLCGIGWLIDIILILTGNLNPKDGEYKVKW